MSDPTKPPAPTSPTAENPAAENSTAGEPGVGESAAERAARLLDTRPAEPTGDAGYRPGRTLPFLAEAARQLTRARTRGALVFLVALPLLLLGAFKVGVAEDPNSATQGVTLGDIATVGAANFTLFTLYVSSGFLLLVVVALFCGDTVASEASWGTLRYLLAAPVPRGRLLRQKFLVGLAYSAFALFLLPTVAMVAGTIAFGWEPLRTQVGAEIPADTALIRIVLVVGYVGVTLLPAGALAFFLSVRTDAPLTAVGGAVLVWMVSAILEAVTALGDLRVLLPTYYDQAWLSLLSSPIETENMLKGCVSAVGYVVVLLTLAWRTFLHKDVVS